MNRTMLFGFVWLPVMLLGVSQSVLSQSDQLEIQFEKEGESLAASRWLHFTVNLDTLQVRLVTESPGMGGGGMGMGMEGDMGGMVPGGGYGGGVGMGMGMGTEGGMGGMGGMSGGYGGEMGMGMGGYGGEMGSGGMGMGGGMGESKPTANRNIYAFVFDGQVINGRARIEVLARAPSFGMGMGVGAGGEGLEESIPNVVGRFISLKKILVAQRTSKKSADAPAGTLTPEVVQFIRDSVSLIVWKRDAIGILRSDEGQKEQSVATEKLLKELLSEEYDLQLARQQMELTRLQERLKSIEIEIARRRQAKDRVVEVQLGKLVLEAQGILEE